MRHSGEKLSRDLTRNALPLDGSGGEMETRIRAFDWSATPVGTIDQWPQSLRTVVNILLSSRYAMWMAWGPELTFFCNDAYRPTLGIKDTWALGAPADRVWAEIWPDIGPRIESVMHTGIATYEEGLLLFLERSGFPEETYHTFSYSPLADDDGVITGMLCVVTEETERLIGERRVETLRGLASAMATTNTEEEVLEALKQQLSRNQKDLPFTLTYLFGEGGGVRLRSFSGISANHPLAVESLEWDAATPWPVHEIALHPAPRLIEDLPERCDSATIPAGDWNNPVELAVLVPIRQQGQERPAGFLVVGTNPYRQYDAAYSGFVDLLSGQIAAALANARAYEAERRRAEALAEIDRAKTTFFSNVSHELRTPLTLMLSPVEELLAQERTAADPEQRHLLELVHRNGLRLQRLVNTLLDFSRIEAGRVRAVYEPTDLAHYTAELAANFRSAMEKAGLEFRVECGELSAPVYVDRDMWEKIVLNLLSNALKFTFTGSVTVRLRTAGEFVELVVQDTGIGIPSAELPRVFERFHRVSGAKGRTIEGTGIGLALVQELVKLHAGSIEVESELSRGTTFQVKLPLGTAHLPKENLQTERSLSSTALRSDMFLQEALRWLEDNGSLPEEVHARSRTTAGTRERILLADDNPDMREYVERLLRDRYDVTAVASGEEALHAAISNPPGLILSDVMMPGLDGFGLLKELRERPETRTIPLILVSARAGEESRVEGLGAGADDYLIKPFTARELLARVGAHLSMSRRRRDAEAALKESQATLQSFYDSSPFLMGVIEIEGDNIVPVYCNLTTAGFFGVDLETFPAQTSEILGVSRATDETWIAHYRQSQREGRSIHFEYEHVKKSSESCWLSATVNHLGAGRIGGPRFSFVAEDITERKKQEELIRRSNEELRRANADLEQFAYSASHDLQEPLRQVAIYSQLLGRKYGSRLDGKASEYLTYCIEGAQRMEMLISDLLAYSQATKTSNPSAEPEFVDANGALEAVRKNLATTIEETRAVITAAHLPVVHGDGVPLMHVFQNLISNALKYRGKERPDVRIWAEQDSGWWRFAVQDNGIGIPKPYQEQVFGIFKRLHDRKDYPGTGIGLAICQRVVERYGGKIWVESDGRQGSTFFFTLPDAGPHER
uniref:histidine kinase n=1 Tax=Solibacter usitatus (strain Ellin6076) TaxID=234267 RepID=Q01RZ5_SOLUE